MTQEWTPTKKWNPFNSAKVLTHVPLWKHIIRGQEIPAPVLVTIDPTNRCNLDCSWCNAKKVRQGGGDISAPMLKEIAQFLGEWGVKAVCIAGGGEPTQHEGFGELIADLMAQNIRIGVVTNGTRIDDFQQMLTFCDWVGISMDAGSHETYRKLKGQDKYHSVIHQAERLIDMARGLNRPLSKPGLGNGVFWKYLVHPSNISEMDLAAAWAQKLGFKGIHFRPVGATAEDVGSTSPVIFSDEDSALFNYWLDKAMSFDDKDFSVYGVQHKFTKALQVCHNFQNCRAVFMTCVFMPPRNDKDKFDLGLCCDRRGDGMTNLLTNADTMDIKGAWGSGHHWALADNIKPHEQCPRCTYAPHNEIFENVIEQDNMTHDFI